MENKEINNLSEFVQIISNLEKTIEYQDISQRKVFLFRGQSKTNLPLKPAIGRKREYPCHYSIFDEERNLIEMAKMRLPGIFKDTYSPIELLALLQHYGIPTRLLDITENAFVALYFACINDTDTDGEVFVFNNNELDITNYPILNAIADSYKFAKGTFYDLSLFYGAVKCQPYFLEQKQTNDICNKDDKQGGDWVYECCQDIHFIYAPVQSLRQQIQQGRYILFNNKIEEINHKYCFEAVIDEIPREQNCISCIIKIPHENKQKILRDLKLFGIDKKTLFADSVDDVCKGIIDDFRR